MPDGRILVIDDEPYIVRLCIQTLIPQGYAVQGVTSGREAIARLEAESFDLLVVDIKMADMDGLTVLRRGRELDPNLTAVVMTAYVTMDNAVGALHAGARGFVPKPFEPSELILAVSEALEERQKEHERLRLRALLPILEISHALMVEGDMNCIAGRLLEAVVRELGADQASLMLLDEKADELYIAGAIGLPAEMVDTTRIPVGEGMAGRSLLGEEPLVVDGEDGLEPSLRMLLVPPDISTAVFVPLRTRKRVVGVLNLSRLAGSKPFTQGDLSLLSTVGSQMATALENARLYEAVTRGKREWEATFNAIADGIFIHDADFRIVRVNQALAGRLGTTPEALLGRYCYEVIHRSAGPPDNCPFLRALDSGHAEKAEWEETNLGGIFQASAYPLRDEEGELWRFVHVLRDITANRRAEKALRESEERYRSLFDGVPVGLYRTTPEGRILDVNLALVRMLGYPDRESLLADGAATVYVNPEDRRRWQALLEREGLVRDFEMQSRRRDGTTIWVLDSAQTVRDADGRVLYYEGSLEDITERKSMEQYVLRTERLAAMGHMAAALAHEVKNPLQAIHSHLELVLDFGLEPDEREEYLRFCCQEVEHLTEITERLLSFARPARDVPSPASIAHLVQRALALVGKPLQHAHAQVTTDFPPDLPSVLVVPGQIAQVLLNLIINATEAMPDGGHVHITARVDGDMVVLTLTNDGPPIPSEHIEHIFAPFFTTKPDGTGLGLFISHTIVEQHGGTISVENLRDDQGVAFAITLPIIRPTEG
jgi:PAS domain S-box-containing protein